MKIIKNIIIFAIFNIRSCEIDIFPQIVPDIIVDVISSHVYHKLPEIDKIKCAFIKDFLETKTRYFLSTYSNFTKSIENFALSASDENCQEILNQIANIIYGEFKTSKKLYPIDYNFVKSLLYSKQNNEEQKAYFSSLISRQNPKKRDYFFQQNTQQIFCNLKYHFYYLDKSQDKILNKNFTDLVSQKIKDLLSPSSKDDLKKIETVYKYIFKKTSSWLINFKNLIK